MQTNTAMRVIIIGGGYAGLSALITLRKLAPDVRLTLIDPRPFHLVITRLHETVHRPLDKIQIPYQELAKRFDFIHIQQAIEFDEALIRRWDSEKCIQLAEQQPLLFDYLLIATGASSGQSFNEPNAYDLATLSENCFAPVLQELIANATAEQVNINILGAGPTGIQFAFEIAHVMLACHKAFHLNLIDGADKLLCAFPEAIAEYVESRMPEKHISLLNNQFYQGMQGQDLLLEHSHTGERMLQRSDLTLLFLGKKPKLVLHANSSGQVVSEQRVLKHIFTAGDCSYYDEMGSNSLTSQSALRKGKAAGKNILLQAGVIGFCLPYMHDDIGYILSLGPSDAVGWVGNKKAIITGLPAFMAKEAIEGQYDLLLSGVDSYVL